MSDLKTPASSVALIGDLVASRRAADRQRLHDRLTDALAHANAVVTALDPLVITAGDEFQGVYARLGDALTASFVVRSRLHPDGEVRFGLGRGPTTTLDHARGIHDGPAYWAARAAIVEVEERAARARTATARTGWTPEHPDAPSAADTAVRAALDCLDYVVGSMSTPSRHILGGLMDGRSQHEVAALLGVSASAVSQRVRRDGIGVALDAMDALGRLP